MLSVIKSKFRFFQMKVEGAFVNASELAQPGLGYSPEVFYPIDMIPSYCKFIFPMSNSVVTTITKVYETIICLKGVGIYNGVFGNTFLYYREKFGCGTVPDNLSIHLSSPLNKPASPRLC